MALFQRKPTEIEQFNKIYLALLVQRYTEIMERWPATKDYDVGILATFVEHYFLCNPYKGDGQHPFVAYFMGLGQAQPQAVQSAIKMAEDVVAKLRLEKKYAAVLQYKHVRLWRLLPNWQQTEEGRATDQRLQLYLNKYTSEELGKELAPMLLEAEEHLHLVD